MQETVNKEVHGLPPKQGLYNPQHEHDACGIGFVADITGEKSNAILRQAITILINLDHRGARGADTRTGDGAGILLQIPHQFFVQECEQLPISLPNAGSYGVGMVFMTQDKDKREQHQQVVEKIVQEEGQHVLGWRDVPCDASTLGDAAKLRQPYMMQVFIGFAEDVSPDAFERKLYVIRKQSSQKVGQLGLGPQDYFYFASLSTKTIVYKGMLTPQQLDSFYLDLQNPAVETALGLVHSRFSTNTFPSWERAHPYRYVIHNGEINTLRGNVNWMDARQSLCYSPLFGQDMHKIMPVIDQRGSDSAIFDNVLEFLHLCGRSLPSAAMMMMPEPWSHHEQMSEEKRAFYDYHSCLMEPWDGPAAVAFSDGEIIGAVLDRNGLRPARYYVTKDHKIVLASEVGVLDIPPENILQKERLRPGRMLLVDTKAGRIIADEELKEEIVSEKPYGQWLKQHRIALGDLPAGKQMPEPDPALLRQRQQMFGYTFEDLHKMIEPMAQNGAEAVGAMGHDAALAVLSDKPQLLYHYFKQLFAQVTNPPIDSIREKLIMDYGTAVGAERNLVQPEPESCRQLRLESPLLSNQDLAKIRDIQKEGFKTTTLPMVFQPGSGGKGLEESLYALFAAADQAIAEGSSLLILSDRKADEQHVPIPALLALSGLQHHLVRKGTRTKVGLLVESAEPREVHHFAVLISYGASAVNPYLAFETVEHMVRTGYLTNITIEQALNNYSQAATNGVVKIMSKMGISTIQSYHGAQIFQAIGIHQEIIDRYFTGTESVIGGIDLDMIAQEAEMRHQQALGVNGQSQELASGSVYQWRHEGEKHLYNPETIVALQQACRNNDYGMYKKFTRMIDQQRSTLRSYFSFQSNRPPVSLEEVEPLDSIFRRFKAGAMSFGSISKEAHEAIAIAMNRIGGKSNTGEGGEDPNRFTPDANGDSQRSAIKQVASGRFGVTSHYLVNADEIQIKMAQGAKPGEGGQLPGGKVYPWIAEVRGTTAGVGLISPPPHHDIYSIEDLAELIHDLKNANPKARISVKLVSMLGVGTIAAGVAKGRADVVLISGYDGGTGASPRTSTRHAGLPWELGLAETHQTLVLNNLRDRIVVETDGKLLTGRDLAIATLLGAEEYGFATALLVVLGCVMMRVCNLDTCPVGVATQNPALRKKFTGDPQYVVNFMQFIAREFREMMAELGFRTIHEMVGATEVLQVDPALKKHWKAKGLDLTPLLYQPKVSANTGKYQSIVQNHCLEKSMDMVFLRNLCGPALERQEKVEATLPIRNTDRVTGTILGSQITQKYGAMGLPEDTIRLQFRGSAGQSFGAFVPKGMTMILEGDSNDYLGKGLSGGKLIVVPPQEATFVPEENIIIGNVALYGATAGEVYIRGVAGERFCVRNSGVKVVVEGVGDHGCEYMTGGRVVVLGHTGKNFAAGMSGGIAYVWDPDGTFPSHCNEEMVLLEPVENAVEKEELKGMLERHWQLTQSGVAQRLLSQWEETCKQFVRVIPNDYKCMIHALGKAYSSGLSGNEAIMEAFQGCQRDKASLKG